MSQANQDFYEKYGTEWFSTARLEQEEMTTLYKVSCLCTLMEGMAPKRILDSGCKPGIALDRISQHFHAADAVGIDISSTMIEHARKRYPEYTVPQQNLWVNSGSGSSPIV